MSELFDSNSQELDEQTGMDYDRYLEFNLGVEKFAIPLLSVKEVIAVPETTNVPFTPEYYLGIMNLRGQVLSIIDLRKRMKVTPKENNSETAVIIVDLEYTHLGVIVDSINRVIAIDNDDFAPPPEIEKTQAPNLLPVAIKVIKILFCS